MRTVKQIYLNKEDLEVLSKASDILCALSHLGNKDSKEVMFNYRDLFALSTPCTNKEIKHWDSCEFSNRDLGEYVRTVLNYSVIIEE